MAGYSAPKLLFIFLFATFNRQISNALFLVPYFWLADAANSAFVSKTMCLSNTFPKMKRQLEWHFYSFPFQRFLVSFLAFIWLCINTIYISDRRFAKIYHCVICSLISKNQNPLRDCTVFLLIAYCLKCSTIRPMLKFSFFYCLKFFLIWHSRSAAAKLYKEWKLVFLLFGQTKKS